MFLLEVFGNHYFVASFCLTVSIILQVWNICVTPKSLYRWVAFHLLSWNLWRFWFQCRLWFWDSHRILSRELFWSADPARPHSSILKWWHTWRFVFLPLNNRGTKTFYDGCSRIEYNYRLPRLSSQWPRIAIICLAVTLTPHLYPSPLLPLHHHLLIDLIVWWVKWLTCLVLEIMWKFHTKTQNS